MIALKLVKTTSDKINTLYHATGQLIYCTDTKKSYFDHEDGSRYSDIDEFNSRRSSLQIIKDRTFSEQLSFFTIQDEKDNISLSSSRNQCNNCELS